MPPWVDWYGYFGADGLGRLTGLWLKLCLSLARRVVLLLAKICRTSWRSGQLGVQCGNFHQGFRWGQLLFDKALKIAASSGLVFLLWAVITWRPLWMAAGPGGQRILSAILLLANASWVISLFWICFSMPRQHKVAVRLRPRS
jgi:hypothetical protein